MTALERVERRLAAVRQAAECREYDEALRLVGALDADVDELASTIRRLHRLKIEAMEFASTIRRLRRLKIEAMEAEREGRLTP